MIAHSAKETGQQKEQWEEGDGWTKFEKEWVGNIGWVFIK